MRESVLKYLIMSIYNFLPPEYKNNIITIRNRLLRKKIVRNWESLGCPIPPPHQVKQIAVEFYKNKYSYNIFIETGTYKGDMVLAQKYNFEKIYSVELDDKLYQV